MNDFRNQAADLLKLRPGDFAAWKDTTDHRRLINWFRLDGQRYDHGLLYLQMLAVRDRLPKAAGTDDIARKDRERWHCMTRAIHAVHEMIQVDAGYRPRDPDRFHDNNPNSGFVSGAANPPASSPDASGPGAERAEPQTPSAGAGSGEGADNG